MEQSLAAHSGDFELSNVRDVQTTFVQHRRSLCREISNGIELTTQLIEEGFAASSTVATGEPGAITRCGNGCGRRQTVRVCRRLPQAVHLA